MWCFYSATFPPEPKFFSHFWCFCDFCPHAPVQRVQRNWLTAYVLLHTHSPTFAASHSLSLKLPSSCPSLPLAALHAAITFSRFPLYASHFPTAPCCCFVPTAAPLPLCHQAPLPVACNWLSPCTGKAGGPRQAGGDPFPWGIQQPPNQPFSGAASFTPQLEQLPLWELHQ